MVYSFLNYREVTENKLLECDLDGTRILNDTHIQKAKVLLHNRKKELEQLTSSPH
jgi:hypothetical protein